MTRTNEPQIREVEKVNGTEQTAKPIRVRTGVRAGVSAPKDSNTGLSIGR
jgi:hypothetical protein